MTYPFVVFDYVFLGRVVFIVFTIEQMVVRARPLERHGWVSAAEIVEQEVIVKQAFEVIVLIVILPDSLRLLPEVMLQDIGRDRVVEKGRLVEVKLLIWHRS